MTISRVIATGAAIALISGSALAVSGTARATGESYVTASQFVNETSPYPAGWFKGTVVNPGTITTVSGGLSVVGPFQILNGTPGAAPAGGLTELASTAKLNVASGDATFQIPLFAGPGQTGYTTLRPSNVNQAGLDSPAGWITSRSFHSFAAGSSHSLQQYDTEAAQSGTPIQLLAYGAFVNPGQTALISTIGFNGDITHFTPEPTGVATPNSISVSDFTSAGKGVSVTLNGFVPGESVEEVFASGSSGGTNGVLHTANENGTVTFSYVGSAQTTPGAYRVGAQGADTLALADVTVVADGTAAAPVATPIRGRASFTG